MNKLIKSLSFLTIAFLTLTPSFAYTGTNNIDFGLYSSNSKDYQTKNLKIYHNFTTWHPRDFAQTKDAITTLNKLSRTNSSLTGLLTIEPWPIYGEGQNRELLLNNIINDKYSSNIKQTCSFIEKNSKAPISLRWGHEMDLYESSIYPWTTSNGELYIRAYKKWVDTCKKYSKKSKFVWSPAGNNGNEKYYPGDNYVDSVGMSWYSYPAFEWYSYGQRILSFNHIMNWKYHALKQFNKPIMIAEFGFAEGNKTNIYESLLNSEKIKREYPLISSIILFSDHTPSWIPGVISSPDWRIDRKKLDSIIK